MEFTPDKVSNCIRWRYMHWLQEHGELRNIILPPPSMPIGGPQAKQCYQITSVPGRGLGVFATKDIKRGQRIFAEPPVLTLDDLAGEYGNRNLKPKQVKEALAKLSPKDQARFMKLKNCFEGDKTRPQYGNEPLLGRVQTNGFGAPPTHDMVIFDKLSRFNHSCRPNAVFSWNEVLLHGVIFALSDIKAGEEIFVDYGVGGVTWAERRVSLKRRFNFYCGCEICSFSDAERDAHDHAPCRHISRLPAHAQLQYRTSTTHSSRAVRHAHQPGYL